MPLLDQVIEKYPRDVKVVFKNYPIKSHENAREAALAALAAGEQGRFWEMHDLLFEHHRNLSGEKIIDLAGELKLDMEKFRKDMKSDKINKMLQTDVRDARRANVTGTPTVFINGRRLKRRNMAAFSKLIDDELKKQKTFSHKPSEGQPSGETPK